MCSVLIKPSSSRQYNYIDEKNPLNFNLHFDHYKNEEKTTIY